MREKKRLPVIIQSFHEIEKKISKDLARLHELEKKQRMENVLQLNCFT